MTTVYTIGHSNTPVGALLDGLRDAGIEVLVDIRRFPSSRRNPQFNAGTLGVTLREAGIEYRHFEALGGRRDPRPDSPNLALSSDAFRGYADHTATPEFDAAVRALIALAEGKPTTVMCAEAHPEGCHRSYLADALLARGHEVIHIVAGKRVRHQMNPLGRVQGDHLVYPALL